MSTRAALNVAYAHIVRDMSPEGRAEFADELVSPAVQRQRAREQRVAEARSAFEAGAA